MTEFFTTTLGLNLNVTWFVLIGVLFTGYVILDGFDLGVGILQLFVRDESQRRVLLNAVGPVWDGNEVWLVTGGGALFAAFPNVYATVFSGFYLAFMLLLAALIFRAVAIEFRGKQPWAWWRRTWDLAFGIASLVVALLLGVAIANIARGIPLMLSDSGQIEYAGGFFNLLNPYALVVGVLTVSLFAAHGCFYALMKTDGALHEKLQRWAVVLTLIFVFFYIAATTRTLKESVHMIKLLSPLFIITAIVSILAVVSAFFAAHRQRHLIAFLSTTLTMISLMALFGLGMFPNLVLSAPDAANSLTIHNAASSQHTLSIMLLIALIGMPLVLAYTVFIYRVFRGKVKLDGHSY